MGKSLNEQIPAVQKRLLKDGLDGWLLYDYRGSNPTARQALRLERHRLTRRMFYFVPARGMPRLFCHSIDAAQAPELAGRLTLYTSWRELQQGLAELAEGAPRVAMEYFPGGAIPQLSRVDGGTLEWLREIGFEVQSSANLVQHFLSRLSPAEAEAHCQAARALDSVKDEAFEWVRDRLNRSVPIDEYELQQVIMRELSSRGLVTDKAPVVAAGRSTADPHYVPSANSARPIEAGGPLLIDLIARQDQVISAFADITWMAWTGGDVPELVADVFNIVVAARDRGLELVRERYDVEAGVGPMGCEVDRAIREVIERHGYGKHFPHRAGHNIGARRLLGDGAHIDDLETRDTRQIVRGQCFSLKPGIYLAEFGVRSEIDVYLGGDGPVVGGPVQRELVRLDIGG